MTATVFAGPNPEINRNAARAERLIDVVTGIPGAEIQELRDIGGRHPKVSFTLPAPTGYAPLEATIGERMLHVGATRLQDADFVGTDVSTCREVVLGQAVQHVLTEALRTHFGHLRTVTGARALDGQLWASTNRTTGTAVCVSLIDPATGRHLHLELERAALVLRTDSRTSPVPASPAAARAHLERVAEAYGRTHGQFITELHVFAGAVLDHPVLASAGAGAA